MSRRLVIFCAVVIVIGLAIPAFAAVQNVKVGGDLKVLGVMRNHLLLRGDSNTASRGERANAGVSIVRVKIDADLTDNVATTARLLNERLWGKESDTASGTGVDVDLAFVTLKEFLYSPLTLVVGRQELRYGNALIIGDPDTNGQTSTRSALTAMTSTNPGLEDLSARKAFDAIKAVLNYDPLVIDLFYSKVASTDITAADDVNLMGVNANYKVNKDLITELYLFRKVSQPDASLIVTTLGNEQDDVVNTIGTRGVYTGVKDLNLGLEAAYQFGKMIDGDTLYPNDTELDAGSAYARSAYAIQAIATYTPAGKKYNPSITASFTHLSGQKDGSADGYKGWDAVAEDQGAGTIFNAIMGYSNANFTNISGSMKPMDDVKVGVDYYNILLDKKYLAANPLTLSGAATTATYTMQNKRHLGDEIDATLTYDYTEDVQLGLSAGMFMPGSAFDKLNRKTASQLVGSMKVVF